MCKKLPVALHGPEEVEKWLSLCDIGKSATASYNIALLRTAHGLMPEGIELVEGSIGGVPLYNGDEEAILGLPSAVEELKGQIVGASRLLLFTP